MTSSVPQAASGGLTHVFDGARRLAAWLATAALAALMVLYLTSLALRGIFGADIPWAPTVSTWLFMWVVFIGSAAVIRDGGMFAVDVLVTKLPKRPFAYYVRLLGLVFAMTGVAFLVVGIEFMTRTTGVSASVGITQNYANIAIPISGVFYILEGLNLIIRPSIYPRRSIEERGVEVG